MIKISFCTVSMNRLHHLMQTLPANLKANADYPAVEFVLVDYNSSDGLENYIKTNFIEYIITGRLKYYRIDTPKYFNRSHSRNLAFKISTGDVICNIDADNFTGIGFSKYLNSIFAMNKDIFISAANLYDIDGKSDLLGRIAVRRTDFLTINGFSEKMISYGFEDYDLINRLQNLGLRNHIIQDTKYLNAIRHENFDRLGNEFESKNFLALYLSYLSPAYTKIMIFFKNHKFYLGTAQNESGINASNINNSPKGLFDFSIKEEKWLKGEWIGKGENVKINRKDIIFKDFSFSKPINVMTQNAETYDFYKITDVKLIEAVLLFYSQITNRIIMEDNLYKRISIIDQAEFGRGILYKNFEAKPITIK